MQNNLSPLICLIIDLDFIIKEKEKKEEPIIRIRGKTKDREDVIIHVLGFYPYFFIDDLAQTTSTVQSLLFADKEFGNWIVDNYQVTKYKYYQNKPSYLFKILGRNPWKILRYSNVLKDKGIKSYENDVSYTSRFLIDTGVKGLNWIKIINYKIVEEENSSTKIYEVNIQNIKNHENGDFQYRILSLGISINTLTEEEKEIKNFSSIINEAEQRIITAFISIGYEEGKTQEEIFILEANTDEAEKKLLEDLLTSINYYSPEIIVTFNGNQVTFPYLINRMEKLGIDTRNLSPLNAKIKQPIGYLGYRIPGYITYDLVKSTRWIRTKSGRKGMTELASEYLGIKQRANYNEINSKWYNLIYKGEKKQKNQIKNDCKQNAKIILSLFFAMGMEEWLEVIKLVGIRPSEGIYSTPRHLGEFQLLRILFNKDTLFPPEPTRKELALRKSTRSLSIGGFVLVPKGTLHEAVLIADFTSMFPSIMVSHNIGGESFDATVASPTQKFKSYPETGLKVMQKEILDKRKELKKEIYELKSYLRSFSSSNKEELEKKLKHLTIQSNAYKVVANSMYGSHNYVGSRFYDTEISNAITSISKEYIQKVEKWTKEFSKGKCQVIYGDTDSIFIKLSDKKTVFRIAEKVKKGHIFSLKDVPEAYEILSEFNIKLPKDMDLEFVDLALRIVFAVETKKRYSYVSVATGELTIVGFEAIRSDTSPFARDVQTEALTLILEDGDILGARQMVIDKCLEFKKLEDESIIEKTIIYGPVRRNPKEYKAKTPTIGALENYAIQNKLSLENLWKEFDRFPYVVVQGNSPLYKRAIHPSLVDFSKIDKEHYIEEALRDVKRIGVKVEMREIQTSNQKTLDFTLSRLNKKKE